jgi:nicotinate-nucleotide pyrophosphorylase (carboxylating)
MVDLNRLSLPALFEALSADGGLDRLVEAAFEEDWGLRGDITTASLIDGERRGRAALIARQAGVVAGLAAVPRIIQNLEPTGGFTPAIDDGDTCAAGQSVARLEGPLCGILALERTLVNLVARMSGVATLTRRFVEAVQGTRAVICDTRKTTPGLRALEKYAVRCGGGTLHRCGLHDAALYKDNHLAHIPVAERRAAITSAAAKVRRTHDLRFVEVEVDDLEQLDQMLACEAGVIDIVLLDNMSFDAMKEAVARRDRLAPHVLLEASGGVTLATVRAVAETGVDRIAVGAITHSAPALDLGLDME